MKHIFKQHTPVEIFKMAENGHLGLQGLLYGFGDVKRMQELADQLDNEGERAAMRTLAICCAAIAQVHIVELDDIDGIIDGLHELAKHDSDVAEHIEALVAAAKYAGAK